MFLEGDGQMPMLRLACVTFLIGLCAGCGGSPTGPDASGSAGGRQTRLTYNGSVTRQLVIRSTTTNSSPPNTQTCTYTYEVTAVIVVIINEPEAEGIAATTTINLAHTPPVSTLTSSSSGGGRCENVPTLVTGWSPGLSGTRSSLTGGSANDGGQRLSFSGSLQGSRLTGTLTYAFSGQSREDHSGIITTSTTSGSVDFPVSLDPLPGER